MLDVRRLRLLCDLSRLGTIAAVAQARTYTPSAVSQQLSALESEAGVALLEHTGRRVALTRPAAFWSGTPRRSWPTWRTRRPRSPPWHRG